MAPPPPPRPGAHARCRSRGASLGHSAPPAGGADTLRWLPAAGGSGGAAGCDGEGALARASDRCCAAPRHGDGAAAEPAPVSKGLRTCGDWECSCPAGTACAFLVPARVLASVGAGRRAPLSLCTSASPPHCRETSPHGGGQQLRAAGADGIGRFCTVTNRPAPASLCCDGSELMLRKWLKVEYARLRRRGLRRLRKLAV